MAELAAFGVTGSPFAAALGIGALANRAHIANAPHRAAESTARDSPRGFFGLIAAIFRHGHRGGRPDALTRYRLSPPSR